MSHVAFRCHAIYENHPPKITSIDTWGKLLVVGTEKGHVLVYEVVSRDDRTRALIAASLSSRIANKPYTVNLKLSQKDFSRRSIDQIVVVQEESLFISLSDGQISVHTLPAFNKVCMVAPKIIKGCHMFAVDYSEHGLRLVAGVKKRLSVFEWTGGDFAFKKELSVPDTVRTVVWCDQALCIGFKREYNIVDIESGGMTELFVTGKTEPISIAMPDRQVLLGRDNISVMVNYAGEPTRKFGLTWSDTPRKVTQSHPFVIAVLARTVEIQFVFGSLSQTIPLAGAEHISVASDGSVYVANKVTDGTIWRLFPLPFAEQVEQLEKRRRYTEALSLVELLPPSQVQDRDGKIARLTLLNAYTDFNTGKHGQAMSTLFELKVDPFQVIALCPGLLPPPLRAQFSFPVPIEELKGPTLTNALTALASYLEQKRKDLRLSERLLQAETSKDNTTYGHSTGEADIGSNEQVDWAETTSLAQIIDTSLLKCYVKSKPELIRTLLRLPNYCHVKECEKVLLNHARFADLVQLYRARGLHRQSLELLRKLSSMPAANMTGVRPTIDYLKECGKEQLDLIFEYAAWVLKSDPQNGLEIFTTVRTPKDQLPPNRVVVFLEDLCHREPSVSNVVVMRYLEFIVCDLENPSPDFHNKLALYYFDMVRELRRAADPSVTRVVAGTEPGLLGKMRSKLLDFLEESEHYTPPMLLSRFNFAEEGLHEERAILLSKIGHHFEALREYVHRLHDFGMAERYCQQHYNMRREEDRTVYLALLKVLMTPPTVPDPPSPATMKNEAAKLLHKYYKEIDPVKALEVLADTTPLTELFPYFEKVLREIHSTHRNLQVALNLQKSEAMRVKAELLKLYSNAVRINDDTTCPVCNKRLGDAIFARYPSGVVIHYLCYKQQADKNIDPVTGERYSMDAQGATI